MNWLTGMLRKLFVKERDNTKREAQGYQVDVSLKATITARESNVKRRLSALEEEARLYRRDPG